VDSSRPGSVTGLGENGGKNVIEMGLGGGWIRGPELMSELNSRNSERRVDLVPRRLDPLLRGDRLEAGKHDPPWKGHDVRCTVSLTNLVASILYRSMWK
jgi:hypothetical protein